MFRAERHESGWWIVTRPGGGELDDSGDGGHFEANAKIIADALNAHGVPLLSWKDVGGSTTDQPTTEGR